MIVAVIIALVLLGVVGSVVSERSQQRRRHLDERYDRGMAAMRLDRELHRHEDPA